MIRAMRDLTAGVFGNLEIKCDIYVDKRVKYTQKILRGTALKKYKQVLEGYKYSKEGLAGYQWNMGAM